MQKMSKSKIKYYDIRDDIKAYPDAWCYLIWSKRGPGKTYSSLRMMIEDKEKFIFMKRTQEDVRLLCARITIPGVAGTSDDISPFAPLNRDFGWSIYPFEIEKGLAGFYEAVIDEDGKLKPIGACLGWIIACSAVTKFKGFNMDANYIIFDEFIPKPWDRVNRTEGDSVMDLYETISRDRVKRGKGELKLICLANATSLNNPMFNTLEVGDYAAEMDILGREYTYLETGVLLHYIQGNFDEDENTKKTGIQRHMEGTAWGAMAYGGHFGYNDFTSIGRTSLKGYRPVCAVDYKRDHYFIYQKEGNFYMTHSKHDSENFYNLNRENDQKKFALDYVYDLRMACIEGKMIFETFTMYDLIVNYKKFFSL